MVLRKMVPSKKLLKDVPRNKVSRKKVLRKMILREMGLGKMLPRHDGFAHIKVS